MVLKISDPMVAIVLPVYNIERYLKECLDSLLCQTYPNIMIFAVDDGSTDGSGEILDEYGRKDRRLVVQHKKNGGVSSARNRALDAIDEYQCKFDFICFVDGDDVVSPDFVLQYVELITGYSADYVVCGWQPFDKKGDFPLARETHPICVTDRKGSYQHFFGEGRWGRGGFVSSSLFLSNRCLSLKTVKGLRFDESFRKGEDQDYLLRALLRVEKGVLSSGVSYRYRIRKSSLSHENLLPVEDLCLYVSLLKNVEKFPFDVQLAIERRARDLWWHVLNQTVNANLLDRYSKHLQDAYKVFISVRPVAPISFSFRRRLFCYSLGDWFLRLYFKRKPEVVCSSELKDAFD